MLKKKYGFTLIELLVVVLIIGILASIALPQYQKAVERSKAVRVLALLKAVGVADEAHYLATGSYASSFEELAVDIPWTGRESFLPEMYGGRDARSNGEWIIQLQAQGENDSCSDRGSCLIHMMRTEGKYKGAGFTLGFVVGFEQEARARTIVCTERIEQGAAYFFDPSLPAGAYCEKIMKGTLINASDFDRNYKLP